MHELGFSFQRAKASYPERNEDKREEVKAHIKKTLDYCTTHQDTVVLFEDEFFLGNTATLSCAWAPVGEQPVISCKQARKERVTGFGTVNN